MILDRFDGHSLRDNVQAKQVAKKFASLTDDERAARELGHLYEGPVYSLPGTMQSGNNWRPVTLTSELLPEDRWLEVARKLGMHDPPLRETYL